MDKTNITPELAEWMKLYEAPFRYLDGSHSPLNGIYDSGNRFVVLMGDYAFGTFIAEKLNELYSQSKENGK